MKVNWDHRREWWYGRKFVTCCMDADLKWINFMSKVENMNSDWRLGKRGKVIGDEE